MAMVSQVAQGRDSGSRMLDNAAFGSIPGVPRIHKKRGKSMSQMKIYGSPMSRAARTMWCAKELGVPFDHVDVPWDKLKEPNFLAINPNGKVPGFIDGNLKLFESLAINLYLAKKYGTGTLYPTNIEDEARVFQWTLWAATELEPLLLPSVLVKLGISKDAEGAKAAASRAPGPMKVLDDHLKTHPWLVGDAFSVADLNAAGVVNFVNFGDIDISYAPNVKAWLARCIARQAADKAAGTGA
jgi:glutathione S-transferase